MSQPRLSLGRSALLLAVAVGSFVIVALLATRVLGDEPRLTGTDLGKQPAPNFSLTDQRGQTVRLSDFRGKAVALTFIYTSCPDICPLVAENLRVAQELLPESSRDDIALLAVTLDPARDTQQALQEFTATHQLADNPRWFALRGDEADLEQVWRDYGIFPGRSPGVGGRGTPVAGGGEGHTDAIYLIDPQGRKRVFLRSSATPQEIASNLAALVGLQRLPIPW